jgi:predicted AlkP superfamily pyrophosphatase or phosphodiesterase
VTSSRRRVLIVQVAALGATLPYESAADDFRFRKMRPVFPAVTCTAQASFRTGHAPSHHGMVANGRLHRDLRKVLFWEQAAALVEGDRIWNLAQAGGSTVGMLFWQQSLGEKLEMVLSPAPIHKHSGGMIQGFNAWPPQLEPDLAQAVGRKFNLFHYWGPFASRKSTAWIAEATAEVLRRSDCPDVLFTYLPHLDYNLQKHGPKHPKAARDFGEVIGWLKALRDAAAQSGHEMVVFGDYAIEQATHGAVFPNKALREAGWLQTRGVKGMQYADLFHSRAFAVADHQVAHVYIRDPDLIQEAKILLLQLPGVDQALDREEQQVWGIDHANAGELVAIASEGAWFAYPWWDARSEAPDYAAHVDIHNKPGYDPCELFLGWPPGAVSMDTRKVKGTHGRVAPGLESLWWSSIQFKDTPDSLLGLAECVRLYLNGSAA